MASTKSNLISVLHMTLHGKPFCIIYIGVLALEIHTVTTDLLYFHLNNKR